MPWEDNYTDRLSQEFLSLQQTIDQAFVEWFDDEYGYEEYSLHITLVSVRYVNLKKIFGKLFLINSLKKILRRTDDYFKIYCVIQMDLPEKFNNLGEKMQQQLENWHNLGGVSVEADDQFYFRRVRGKLYKIISFS